MQRRHQQLPPRPALATAATAAATATATAATATDPTTGRCACSQVRLQMHGIHIRACCKPPPVNAALREIIV